jgi:hypothetical protein
VTTPQHGDVGADGVADGDARAVTEGGGHRGHELFGLGTGQDQAHGERAHAQPAAGGRGVLGEELGSHAEEHGVGGEEEETGHGQ